LFRPKLNTNGHTCNTSLWRYPFQLWNIAQDHINKLYFPYFPNTRILSWKDPWAGETYCKISTFDLGPIGDY
jgi:hypothetical protein